LTLPLAGSTDITDLDGSNGFALDGVTGRTVSDAGDVNGDGLDDLVIRSDDAVYVVFGASGLGSSGVLEASDLDGSNGFLVNGASTSDTGRSFDQLVSGAGDVNGDGIDDLVIGDYYAPGGYYGGPVNGLRLPGVSYVIFGANDLGNTGALEVSDLDGDNGFVIFGANAYDYSGSAVSSAGDVNGDGVDDLLIGAVYAYGGGATYVLFGGVGLGNTGELALTDLSNPDGFVITNTEFGGDSGVAVSGAGDINGDGVDDILVTAEYVPADGNIQAGRAFVVFGSSSVGSTGPVDLSELNGTNGFALLGVGDERDQFDFSLMIGHSVSGAGDVNGDGADDLIIASNFSVFDGGAFESSLFNAGYVVFGGSGVGNTGELPLSELNGDNGFVLIGSTTDSVSGAGDVNGDGVDDLLIGSFSTDFEDLTNVGTSHVVFGGSNLGSSGILELFDLNGSNGFTLNASSNSADFGRSVSNAGDVNADGVDDIVIGADNTSYVVFGMQSPVDSGPGSGGPTQCNGLTITVNLNNGDTPTGGDDVILGTPGADIINALAGNDTICGEGGNDILNAGSGDDWVSGGAGNDVIRGGRGDDQLLGQAGDDSIIGSIGDDTIEGGGGQDQISGGAGRDIIFTGAGATVGSGVFVSGGSGADMIFGGPDADDIRGDNGADVINGNNGNDMINGGSGNDLIRGGGGADDIGGGAGNDEIQGDAGNDVLRGGGGVDRVLGGNGNDSLSGGALSGDVCDGGSGTDTALGSCESTVNVP